MPKNTIQIMCKHKTLDADFSPKTMECFYNIVDEDDDAEFDGEDDCAKYQRLAEKDAELFSGFKVEFGDYICYMKDVTEVEQ